jgi:CMP/dCMP kinase
VRFLSGAQARPVAALFMTVIAIDGPAGAGKSSVARGVAQALGFRYVDTGAMYRTVARAAVDRGIDPSDQNAVEHLARAMESEIDPELQSGTSEKLRDPAIGTAASIIAQYPGVRSALAGRQREVARGADVVMEGRDIGTVIAPDADVKLYLTASRRVRAERRRQQLELPEDDISLNQIEEALAKRDQADSERFDSPLKPAADAIHIDSSDRDLAAVLSEVLDVINERLHSR